VENHAGTAQALQPGAQERRGFHVGGENASGAADEGFHAKASRPFAQGRWTKGVEQWRQLILPAAIAGAKGWLPVPSA
jgi:hypothetical protein